MNKIIDIQIRKTSASKLAMTNFDNLAFGQIISDHMFVADYKDGEWQDLRIEPYAPLMLNTDCP